MFFISCDWNQYFAALVHNENNFVIGLTMKYLNYTYIVSLGVFQQTAGILNVFLFSSTCLFIRTRQTSYKGFSRKLKEANPIL